MGCLGSKPATPEEQQEICKRMAKEMMTICAGPAFDNADKIKIAAPPAFDNIKKTSAELRENAQKPAAKETPAPEQGAGEKSGGGGGMMGLLNKATDMVTQAMEKASELGEKSIAAILTGLADALDKAVAQVEEPMTHIGKDIVSQKKAELQTVLNEHITYVPVPDAVNMCKGPETAISDHLITKSSKNIAAKLEPVVGEAIAQHVAIQSWNSAIEKYNGAIEKIASLKFDMGGFAPTPIQLDIKEYICEQAVLEIGKLMGVEEAQNRKDPKGKGKHPAIFEKVFTEQDLLYSDYKKVTS